MSSSRSPPQKRGGLGSAGRGRPAGCSRQWGRPPAPRPPLPAQHLDLLEGDLEAEGLVEVRVQGLLLHCRLLLLEPLAVLHQVDLHVGVCAEAAGEALSTRPARQPRDGRASFRARAARGFTSGTRRGCGRLELGALLGRAGTRRGARGPLGGVRPGQGARQRPTPSHPPNLVNEQRGPEKGTRLPEVTRGLRDRAGLAGT